MIRTPLSIDYVINGPLTYSLASLFNINPNLLVFILINQICWLNLIIHIRNFKLMGSRFTYEEVRKTITKFELRAIIFLVVVYVSIFAIIFINIFAEYVSNCPDRSNSTFWLWSKILQFINGYFSMIITFILAFTVIKLYYDLKTTLKLNLNYYYEQKK